MRSLYILMLCLMVLLLGCKEVKKEEYSSLEIQEPTLAPKKNLESTKLTIDYDSTLWAELTTADSMIIDLRYATKNNFTNQQVYDCARCFLRPEVAHRIRRINFHLQRKYNWRLKLFDCYRPRPYQQRLWDIVPNPIYVSDPKKGSMHNRGAAVDLTIVDEKGVPLDMGTEFDHFGRRAHTDFMELSDTILSNRKILQDIMIGNGFKGIQSEWWHFSISGLGSELSEWVWDCRP